MEDYTEQLRDFGGLFLAGFGNDAQKATEALKKSNNILKENPRILPALADEGNQKQIGEIIKFIESGKGNFLTIIPKVQDLAKKLKF